MPVSRYSIKGPQAVQMNQERMRCATYKPGVERGTSDTPGSQPRELHPGRDASRAVGQSQSLLRSLPGSMPPDSETGGVARASLNPRLMALMPPASACANRTSLSPRSSLTPDLIPDRSA